MNGSMRRVVSGFAPVALALLPGAIAPAFAEAPGRASGVLPDRINESLRLRSSIAARVRTPHGAPLAMPEPWHKTTLLIDAGDNSM
ncbi:MAG: hypothetical protein ACTS3F_08755 [Phycisphaerales bacterium]